MLAAIVKRELIDHLISLRFGLALVLIVGLMVLKRPRLCRRFVRVPARPLSRTGPSRARNRPQPRPNGLVEADRPRGSGLYL